MTATKTCRKCGSSFTPSNPRYRLCERCDNRARRIKDRWVGAIVTPEAQDAVAWAAVMAATVAAGPPRIVEEWACLTCRAPMEYRHDPEARASGYARQEFLICGKCRSGEQFATQPDAASSRWSVCRCRKHMRFDEAGNSGDGWDCGSTAEASP